MYEERRQKTTKKIEDGRKQNKKSLRVLSEKAKTEYKTIYETKRKIVTKNSLCKKRKGKK